MTYATVIIGFE